VKIERIDHFVLTVADPERTCEFYSRVLGLEVVEKDGRRALRFGRQKINLHPSGKEIEPKAGRPTPGSGDFCLITATPLEEVQRHIEAAGVRIETGPVERSGALGRMTSVYFRDPDGNLVEVSKYLPGEGVAL